MDLGAGEGRVLASAMKFGAKSVVGYELPANSAHKFVYDAVLRRIFAGVDFKLMASNAQWLAKDIDQVFYLQSHCVIFFDSSCGIYSDNFPFISSPYFPNKRKSSTLFGMECLI